MEPDIEQRLRQLESEVSGLRQELGEAADAQDRLHQQLSNVLERLESYLRQRGVTRTPSEADKNYGLQIGRLESRMRSVEQKVERVSGQVGGILESRIWRTLVQGGGFFLRVFRK